MSAEAFWRLAGVTGNTESALFVRSVKFPYQRVLFDVGRDAFHRIRAKICRYIAQCRWLDLECVQIHGASVLERSIISMVR